MVPETSNTIHNGSFRRHASRSDPGPSSAILKLNLTDERMIKRGLGEKGDELVNLRAM